MAQNWQLLDNRSCEGHYNMALDNFLARKAKLTKPVLRFYTWKPYAITIGFHQDIKEIDQGACCNDKIDLVRRPTGGRAILHAQEITYSVIIPDSHPIFAQSTLDVYNIISQALVLGLQNLGLPAVFDRNRYSDMHNRYQHEFACYATSAKYEIQCNGRKLVGSAQRRFKRAILQHGSVLTGNKHLDLTSYLAVRNGLTRKDMRRLLQNKTISLTDILGHTPSYNDLIKVLMTGFRETFETDFEQCNLQNYNWEAECENMGLLEPSSNCEL